MEYVLKQPIPIIPVTDLQRSLDFYVSAYGFHNPQKYTEDYGAVERDGMYLHFTVRDHINPLMVYNYVEHVDTVYELAKSRGISIESEIADMPYGMREFTTRDPDGHYILFAQSCSA